MRILNVCPWPGPPLSGGVIPMRWLLRELAAGNELSLVVVDRPGAPPRTRESLADLEIPVSHLAVVERPLPTRVDRFTSALFGSRPSGFGLLERRLGPVLRHEVESLVESFRPDVLLLWRRSWASSLAGVGGVPKVLHAVDSTSMVMESYARSARNPAKRWLYRRYAKRHASYEQEVFPRFDHVLFIARRDADHVGLVGTPVTVVPLGVDTQALRPLEPDSPRPRPDRVVFHGGLYTKPNRECARILCETVGPRLADLLGPEGFQLRICGPRGGDDLAAMAAKRPWACLTGFVDDLRLELASAAVYAAPLSMGGGMKSKVVEAMACGLPVVGTEEAFSGLDLDWGVHAVRCPIERIADELASLLRDPARRVSIGRAARAWVSERASWEAAGRILEGALERAASGGR